MINRANYNEVQEYMLFKMEIKKNGDGSGVVQRGRMWHLLEWADEKSMVQANRIKPGYSDYLEGLLTDQGKPLAGSTLAGICKTAREFFRWAKRSHAGRYRMISDDWIESLRPGRERSESAELKTREIYTLGDVLKLVHYPAGSMAEKRIRAAAAMLFLSAMRAGAFVTLPMECVDLAHMRIWQLPAKGVKTKNRKAAKTTLLEIPELIRVVQEWDDFIRPKLAESAYWFTRLNPDGELTTGMTEGEADPLNTRSSLRHGLEQLCERAEVEYHSPHKLRHGHAVWALKQAKTMAELKSISQNLMHSSIGITDGIYGRLVEDDVHEAILGLGKEKKEEESELELSIERVLRKILKERET